MKWKSIGHHSVTARVSLPPPALSLAVSPKPLLKIKYHPYPPLLIHSSIFPKVMAMAISISPKPTVCALNGNRVSPTLRFWRRTRVQTELTRRRNFSFRSCLDHRPAIIRSSQVEDRLVTRRLSPVLESALLAGGNGDLSTSEWQAVPDIWKSTAEKYGDRVALVDPYHDPPSQLTYKQLEQEILDFSEGLRDIGFLPDEKVALFADNSCRWLVADQGIMATGAINVVRGARSSNEELYQIYEHSESIALVVDSPDFFNRIAESFLPKADIRVIILLWGEKSCLREIYSPRNKISIPTYEYKDITDLGRKARKKLLDLQKEGQQDTCQTISPDDVATLMYTSGTSGSPKGVMLTHQNLLHQIKNFWDCVPAVAGDRFVSILPPWHAYERASEYFIFTHGSEQVYSNVKNLKEDLRRYQPQYLVSVPLVYETLYSSILKQISSASATRKFIALTLIKVSMLYMEGKRVYEGKVLTQNQNQQPSIVLLFDWLWGKIVASILWPLHILGMKLVYNKIHSAIGISKAGISGGGNLPTHVDKFFEAIGVKVQNGYGLTETSPVVAVRRPYCNVLGTVGPPLNDTEIKIIDIDTSSTLPDGSKGIVKIRGPQVMKGYFKNPSATREALDKEGWFNTGDIGWIVPKHSAGRSRECGGMLVLEGRAKDTIVLSTGENVEPSELEDAALRSSLIQQIVVVGQDQRRLGALIVPNKDEIISVAKKQGILNGDDVNLSKEKMKSLVYNDLRTWISGCTFQIGPILIVDDPFTIDNGLMTPTMKIRRDRVAEKYKEQIADLYK